MNILELIYEIFLFFVRLCIRNDTSSDQLAVNCTDEDSEIYFQALNGEHLSRTDEESEVFYDVLNGEAVQVESEWNGIGMMSDLTLDQKDALIWYGLLKLFNQTVVASIGEATAYVIQVTKFTNKDFVFVCRRIQEMANRGLLSKFQKNETWEYIKLK